MNMGRPRRRRVMVIYGTRPEAIKLAPVIREIHASPGLCPIVVLTGQHRAIVHQVNSMFGVRPDYDLDVIRKRQSLDGLTSRVLQRLTPALRKECPDAVVVQGDTTSAFAAALAAFYEQIPVVHVEAGLRTDDIYSPFPEEANRRLTSQIAALHLAPTPLSEHNLLRSGIPPNDVLVTGNTVIDALLWTAGQPVPYGRQDLEAVDETETPVLLVTTHRREAWGRRMREVADAVARLARSHPELVVVLPVHPNPIVRDSLLPGVRGLPNVIVVEPMGYGEFARMLRRSTIVLTDSGGIQEEAPSLGKPVLVTRDTTERPEAVHAGTARLVGTDPAHVYAEVDRLLTDPRAYQAMANAVNPYGDGRAAHRTVGAIEHMFGLGSRPEPFEPSPYAASAEGSLFPRPSAVPRAGSGGIQEAERGLPFLPSGPLPPAPGTTGGAAGPPGLAGGRLPGARVEEQPLVPGSAGVEHACQVEWDFFVLDVVADTLGPTLDRNNALINVADEGGPSLLRRGFRSTSAG